MRQDFLPFGNGGICPVYKHDSVFSNLVLNVEFLDLTYSARLYCQKPIVTGEDTTWFSINYYLFMIINGIDTF